MPIRRSINKRKRIWYHRRYGSLENPPLSDMGYWPSGSAVVCSEVARYRGQSVLMGWICYLNGTKHYGIWIASRVAISRPFSMNGTAPVPPKGKQFIDSSEAVRADYEFYSVEPETTPFYKLVEILTDGFADRHELLL